MRTSFRLTLASLWLILMLPGAACAGEAPTRLFVLSQGRALALANIDRGKFSPFKLALEGKNSDGETSFRDAGLVPPGTQLHIYQSGRQAGLAAAGDTAVQPGSGCSEGDYVSLAALPGQPRLEDGIAATKALRKPDASSVREPVASEGALGQRMADSLLRKRGVAVALRAHLRKEMKIRLATLQDNAAPVMIASSAYENDGQVHSLFFVAEKRVGGYAPTYVRFYSGAQGQGAEYSADYVDHADLDGDGHAEIVLLVGIHEEADYLILRKRGGQWHEELRAFRNGC